MQSGAGPRPFDVTTGFLIELDARAWLDWLGLPVTGEVRSIESDVATVLAEVDKVLRIDGPSPWLAHVELQASHDPRLPVRMLQYHALLLHRHQVPVETTVILLRPQADGPEMTGLFEQHGAVGNRTVAFNFRVVRVWERPVDELLTAGLGVLPLAPLAAVTYEQLAEVIQRIDDRLSHETDAATADDLRAAISLLLGLRYDDEQIEGLVRRMSWIQESSVYQAIVERGRSSGRVAEARDIVLRLGTRKFGPPDAATRAVLDEPRDLTAYDRMIDRILSAETWDELLAPLQDR